MELSNELVGLALFVPALPMSSERQSAAALGEERISSGSLET